MIIAMRGIQAVLCSAVIILGAAMTFGPRPLAAVDEEPCELAGLPGIGECDPDREHIYEESCEGIDCYYELEICCDIEN